MDPPQPPRWCGGRVVVSGLSQSRRPRSAALVVFVVTALARPAALVADNEPTIARVAITGNLRVEEDAIRVHLRSQPGMPFDQETLDRDIRAVYGMGFFDQVDADVSPEEGHRVVVTLRLKERPLVRAVKVEGTDKVKKEEVEGALKIRPHAILDPEKAWLPSNSMSVMRTGSSSWTAYSTSTSFSPTGVVL